MLDFDALARTIRSLRRSPAYVAVSVLSLGVALGLTTATFALVDGALHQKVRFADPGRLFVVDLRYGNQHNPPSLDVLAEALRAAPAVEDVAVEHGDDVYLKLSGVPTVYSVRYVTPNLVRMAGVRPRLGRYPMPAEIAAERAVVVSSRLWADQFAGRPAIGDASLNIKGHIYSGVGVLPTGNDGGLGGDIILPTASATNTNYRRSGLIHVKLRSGFDSAAVRAQLATIAAGLTAHYVSPTSASPPYRLDRDSWIPSPPKLRDHLFELLLTAIAFGVLLIGCMNVAALGLTAGVAIALGTTRLLSSLLFGVTSTDPAVFAGVAIGLIAVATVATYLPARRAARVDPVIALRAE